MSSFRHFVNLLLAQFSLSNAEVLKDSLDLSSADSVRERIDRFAIGLTTTSQALRTDQRRSLSQTLKDEGYLD